MKRSERHIHERAPFWPSMRSETNKKPPTDSQEERRTAMRVIITAVGSDHWGLADPIVHYVTAVGAHIAEIQMYDSAHGGDVISPESTPDPFVFPGRGIGPIRAGLGFQKGQPGGRGLGSAGWAIDPPDQQVAHRNRLARPGQKSGLGRSRWAGAPDPAGARAADRACGRRDCRRRAAGPVQNRPLRPPARPRTAAIQNRPLRPPARKRVDAADIPVEDVAASVRRPGGSLPPPGPPLACFSVRGKRRPYASQ
jgi:hypothetical protein